MRTLVAITECVYALRHTDATSYSTLYTVSEKDAARYVPSSDIRPNRVKAEKAPRLREGKHGGQHGRHAAPPASTADTPFVSHTPSEWGGREAAHSFSSSSRRLFTQQETPAASEAAAAASMREQPELISVEESQLRYRWPREASSHASTKPDRSHAEKSYWSGEGGLWRSHTAHATPLLNEQEDAVPYCDRKSVSSVDGSGNTAPSLLRLRITPLPPSPSLVAPRDSTQGSGTYAPSTLQQATNEERQAVARRSAFLTTFTAANRTEEAARDESSYVSSVQQNGGPTRRSASSSQHLSAVVSQRAARLRPEQSADAEAVPATSSSTRFPSPSLQEWQREMQVLSPSQPNRPLRSALTTNTTTTTTPLAQSASPFSVTVAAVRHEGSVVSHGTIPSRLSMRSATTTQSNPPSPSPAAPAKDLFAATGTPTYRETPAQPQQNRSHSMRRSKSGGGSSGDSTMRRRGRDARHASTRRGSSASQSAASFVQDARRHGLSSQSSKEERGPMDRRTVDPSSRHSTKDGAAINDQGFRPYDVNASPLLERYTRHTAAPPEVGGGASRLAAHPLPRLASPPQRPHRALHLSPSPPSSPVPRSRLLREENEDISVGDGTALLRAAVQRMQQASDAAMDANATPTSHPSSAADRYALLVESARLLSSSVLVFTALAPGDRQHSTSAIRSASGVYGATPPHHTAASAQREEPLHYTELREPQARYTAGGASMNSAAASPLPAASPVPFDDNNSERLGHRGNAAAAPQHLHSPLRPQNIFANRMEEEMENGTAAALHAAPRHSGPLVTSVEQQQQRQPQQYTMRRSISADPSAHTTATSIASSVASVATEASVRRRAVLAPEDILKRSQRASHSSAGQRPTAHRGAPVEEPHAVPSAHHHIEGEGEEQQRRCPPLKTRHVRRSAESEPSRESAERSAGSSATREVSINRPPLCATHIFADANAARQPEVQEEAAAPLLSHPRTAQHRYYSYVSPVKNVSAREQQQQQTDEVITPRVVSASVSPLTPPPLASVDYRSPHRGAGAMEGRRECVAPRASCEAGWGEQPSVSELPPSRHHLRRQLEDTTVPRQQQLPASTVSNSTSFSHRHRAALPSIDSSTSAFDWVADDFAAAHPRYRDVSSDPADEEKESEEGRRPGCGGASPLSALSTLESRLSFSRVWSESPPHRQRASAAATTFTSGEGLSHLDVGAGSAGPLLRRRLSSGNSSSSVGRSLPPPPPPPLASASPSPIATPQRSPVQRPRQHSQQHANTQEGRGVHHGNPSFSFAGSLLSAGGQSSFSVERTPTMPSMAHVAAMEMSRSASQIPLGAALFADPLESSARSVTVGPQMEREGDEEVEGHARHRERGERAAVGGERGGSTDSNEAAGAVLWVDEEGRYFSQPRVVDTDDDDTHSFAGGPQRRADTRVSGEASSEDGPSRASTRPRAASEWEERRADMLMDETAAAVGGDGGERTRSSRQSTVLRSDDTEEKEAGTAPRWSGEPPPLRRNAGTHNKNACQEVKAMRDAAPRQQEDGAVPLNPVTAAQAHSSSSSAEQASRMSSASTSPQRSASAQSAFSAQEERWLLAAPAAALQWDAVEEQRDEAAFPGDHLPERQRRELSAAPPCHQHDATSKEAKQPHHNFLAQEDQSAAATRLRGTHIGLDLRSENSTAAASVLSPSLSSLASVPSSARHYHHDPQPPPLPLSASTAAATRARLAVPKALSKPPMVPTAQHHRPRLAEAAGHSRLLSPSLALSNTSEERDERVGAAQRRMEAENEEADFFEDDEDGYCSYGYGGEDMEV